MFDHRANTKGLRPRKTNANALKIAIYSRFLQLLMRIQYNKGWFDISNLNAQMHQSTKPLWMLFLGVFR